MQGIKNGKKVIISRIVLAFIVISYVVLSYNKLSDIKSENSRRVNTAVIKKYTTEGRHYTHYYIVTKENPNCNVTKRFWDDTAIGDMVIVNDKTTKLFHNNLTKFMWVVNSYTLFCITVLGIILIIGVGGFMFMKYLIINSFYSQR
jgi:hypothetical protein